MILHGLIWWWISCLWAGLLGSENNLFVILKDVIDSLVDLRLCLAVSRHWKRHKIVFLPQLCWLRCKNTIVDAFKLLIRWRVQIILIIEILWKIWAYYAVLNTLAILIACRRAVLIRNKVVLQCHSNDQVTHFRHCCRSTQCVIVIINRLTIVSIIKL